MRIRLIGALALGFTCLTSAAFATEAPPVVKIEVQKEGFTPNNPTAIADKSFTLEIKNSTATAVEFESKSLRIEKMIAAGATVKLPVRALKAGDYQFFNEMDNKMPEGSLKVQ